MSRIAGLGMDLADMERVRQALREKRGGVCVAHLHP